MSGTEAGLVGGSSGNGGRFKYLGRSEESEDMEILKVSKGSKA